MGWRKGASKSGPRAWVVWMQIQGMNHGRARLCDVRAASKSGQKVSARRWQDVRVVLTLRELAEVGLGHARGCVEARGFDSRFESWARKATTWEQQVEVDSRQLQGSVGS